MDESTLREIAKFICGDARSHPVYRSGYELTEFFQRAGLPQFVHEWLNSSVMGLRNTKSVYQRTTCTCI